MQASVQTFGRSPCWLLVLACSHSMPPCSLKETMSFQGCFGCRPTAATLCVHTALPLCPAVFAGMRG